MGVEDLFEDLELLGEHVHPLVVLAVRDVSLALELPEIAEPVGVRRPEVAAQMPLDHALPAVVARQPRPREVLIAHVICEKAMDVVQAEAAKDPDGPLVRLFAEGAFLRSDALPATKTYPVQEPPTGQSTRNGAGRKSRTNFSYTSHGFSRKVESHQ